MIIDIAIAFFVFLFGSSIGSFLHATSERVFNKEEFIKSRSHCLACNKTLSALDLVPFFSYIFLNGKCRYCKAKIPFDVFLAETILGILYVCSYFVAKPLLDMSETMFILYWGYIALSISFFFFVALYDYRYYIIPDVAVYLATLFTALLLIVIYILHLAGFSFFAYADYNTFLFQHFITAIVLFLFFLSIYIFTKARGIGGGDVKLSFLIGLLLGARPTIIFLYVAFFSGALVSVVLLLGGSRKIKDSIPFGPFLAFGVIIAILYSGAILNTPIFSFVNYLTSLF